MAKECEFRRGRIEIFRPDAIPIEFAMVAPQAEFPPLAKPMQFFMVKIAVHLEHHDRQETKDRRRCENLNRHAQD